MSTVCRICKRCISHRGRTAIYCDTCRDSRTRERNRQAAKRYRQRITTRWDAFLAAGW